MSHFIIWSYSATYFGTPNGHASTQFEQPMQRGFNDDCTTPSSFCLMASAGHTSAHVGSSQCMHTIGAVWVVAKRSISSRWIIVLPRWVPHSSHAWTHAGHPMPSPGSEAGLRGSSPLVSRSTRSISRASTTAAPGGPTRSMRTAETLYSGIFDSGSSARFVSWLAAWRPAQWYGMKIVSGRIVDTTFAGRIIVARRDVTRTTSPVAMPCWSARRGFSSHSGSGYCARSGPILRVWVPDRYWLTTRPVVSHTG